MVNDAAYSDPVPTLAASATWATLLASEETWKINAPVADLRVENRGRSHFDAEVNPTCFRYLLVSSSK